MLELKIASQEFYSNYIFYPFEPELSFKDKLKAFVSSAALFVFTLGIFHLACYIKYRNRKFNVCNKKSSPTISKVVDLVAEKKLIDKLIDNLRNPNLKTKERLALIENAASNDFFDFSICTGYVEAALIYRTGVVGQTSEDSIEKDVEKAVFLLHKAIDRRDMYARDILAEIYINGEAKVKDTNAFYKFVKEIPHRRRELFKLTEMAASLGSVESMVVLGEFYRLGEHDVVKVDYPKAVFWFEKAAAQGDSHACKRLGNIFLFGEDQVPKDAQKGAEWLLMAFNKGAAEVEIVEEEKGLKGHSVRVQVLRNKQVAINFLKARPDVNLSALQV